MHIILGLLNPDAGRVILPKEARMAAIFQEDRLIEHLSAAGNIRLIAGEKKLPDAEITRALCRVDLDPANARRISKYSGGMKRRVAIVRAALYRPDILILDEPFKGMDARVREKTARFLLEACPDCTKILVTHDPVESELLEERARLTLRRHDPLPDAPQSAAQAPECAP